jgi:hypothetical protein
MQGLSRANAARPVRSILLVRVDPSTEPDAIVRGAGDAPVLRVHQILPACTRIRAVRPAAVIVGSEVPTRDLGLLASAAEEVGADFLHLGAPIGTETLCAWVEAALARPSPRSSGIRTK